MAGKKNEVRAVTKSETVPTESEPKVKKVSKKTIKDQTSKEVVNTSEKVLPIVEEVKEAPIVATVKKSRKKKTVDVIHKGVPSNDDKVSKMIIEEDNSEVTLGKTGENPVINNKVAKDSIASSQVPVAKKPKTKRLEKEQENVDEIKEFIENQIPLADDETIEIGVVKKNTKKNIKKSRASKMSGTMNIARFSPLLSQGLTSSQVDMRHRDGLNNVVNKSFTKSYGRIIFDNVFTFFNMLLTIIAIALLIVGSYTDLMFVVIMVANMTIGIIQEIKAKKTIDKLTLVTAPSTTVIRNGTAASIPIDNIVLDDIIVLSIGNQISADAIVKDGMIEVNESLLTGESLPVKKRIGDPVYAGSFVVSGQATCQVDKIGLQSYAMTLQSQAKRYSKPRSELVRALNNIIKVISIIIVPIGIALFFVNLLSINGQTISGADINAIKETIEKTAGSIIGMIPAGMFLLTSVALAMGVLSLSRHNTSVKELYCIEMLARVNVLCLDKTGTLTDGTMNVEEVVILKNGHDINRIMGSYLSCLTDNNQTSIALQERFPFNTAMKEVAKIPFSSSRKYSAVSFEKYGTYIMGAPEFIVPELDEVLEALIATKQAHGYRVLMLAHSHAMIKNEQLKGVITPVALFILVDHIRKEAPDTIKWFRENGVEIKIISGDNPLTASEIARNCGVVNADKYISLEGLSINEVGEIADKYTVFGRVSPEQKASLIKALKNRQNIVAMTGDGVNDILAMKNADCSIAMAGGSEATKNVAHLILLDSNFASMPKVVEEGRRVINNVQRSSSLFLMKTFFTIILSVAILVINLFGTKITYPFSPKNLIIMEVVGIGIPSTLLAIQPNKSLIKGHFLKTVITRALPGTMLLLLSVVIGVVLNSLGFFENGENALAFPDSLTTLIIIAMVASSLIMLFRICQPFNVYRGTLFVMMVIFAVFGVFVVPPTFTGIDYQLLNKLQAMTLIIMTLCFAPLSFGFNKVADKILTDRIKLEAVPE